MQKFQREFPSLIGAVALKFLKRLFLLVLCLSSVFYAIELFLFLFFLFSYFQICLGPLARVERPSSTLFLMAIPFKLAWWLRNFHIIQLCSFQCCEYEIDAFEFLNCVLKFLTLIE